jgi:hypothetical protein
VPKKDLD